MIFFETKLKGAYIIELEKLEDQRGFFARTWCKDEYRRMELDANLVQCNISFNKKRGTLRGMHYQSNPYEETKLVRCTRGSIYDVIIDIRPKSITFKQWFAIELSASNRKMLYIPKGFAHGFQTLEDETEVFYQMSEYYHAQNAKGLRWNSPQIGIKWPLEQNITISIKDKNLPDFI